MVNHRKVRLAIAAVRQVHLVVAHHRAILQGHLADDGMTRELCLDKDMGMGQYL